MEQLRALFDRGANRGRCICQLLGMDVVARSLPRHQVERVCVSHARFCDGDGRLVVERARHARRIGGVGGRGFRHCVGEQKAHRQANTHEQINQLFLASPKRSTVARSASNVRTAYLV